MGAKLLTPGDLQAITEKTHLAKVQEQFERVKKEEQERKALHEAFPWNLSTPPSGAPRSRARRASDR